jgi:hypothetical protein
MAPDRWENISTSGKYNPLYQTFAAISNGGPPWRLGSGFAECAYFIDNKGAAVLPLVTLKKTGLMQGREPGSSPEYTLERPGFRLY